MIFLFENFAETRLEVAVDQTATILRVPASDSAKLPVPTLGSHRFPLILFDGRQEPEICWGVSNDLTGDIEVTRGEEDTAAKSWQTGTAVINAPTKTSLNYLASGGADSWHDELVELIDEAYARIDIERNLRISADEAFAESVETLTAGLAGQVASFGVLSQAFADLSTAWALYQVSVTAQTSDAVAKATQSLNASSANGMAIAQLRTDLETAVGDNFAAFALLIEAFTDFDESQVLINLEIESRMDDAEAGLSEEILVRTTQYEALVEVQAELSAELDDAFAEIENESLVRATADLALAEESSLLSARLDAAEGDLIENAAEIEELRSVSATARAAQIHTLQRSFVRNARGFVSTLAEQKLRITGELAIYEAIEAVEVELSGDLTTLSGTVAGHTLLIADLEADKVEISVFELLETEVEDLGEDLVSTQGQVTSNTSLISGLEVYADSLADQIDLLALDITDLEGDIASIVTVTNGLSAEVEDLDGRVTLTESAIETVEQVIATERAAGVYRAQRAFARTARSYVAQRAEVLLRATEDSALFAEIEAVEVALDADIGTLTAGLSSTNTLLTSLTGDVTALEGTVGLLALDLEDLEDAVVAVGTEVDSLQVQVDAVEAGVETVTQAVATQQAAGIYRAQRAFARTARATASVLSERQLRVTENAAQGTLIEGLSLEVDDLSVDMVLAFEGLIELDEVIQAQVTLAVDVAGRVTGLVIDGVTDTLELFGAGVIIHGDLLVLGSVTTERLVENVINEAIYASTAHVSIPSTTSGAPVASGTITCNGRAVEISTSMVLECTDPTLFYVEMEIKRGSTTIFGPRKMAASSKATGSDFHIYGPLSWSLIDVPPGSPSSPQNHTYTVIITRVGSFATLNIYDASLTARLSKDLT